MIEPTAQEEHDRLLVVLNRMFVGAAIGVVVLTGLVVITMATALVLP